MHNVTVLRKIRQLPLLSPQFDYIDLFFFLLRQDAIKSVSKEGRHLLLSLEISGMEDEAQWDVRMDWETVQRWLNCPHVTFSAPYRFSCFSGLNIFLFYRLLAQLRDMESAFDGFFEKHRLKLHQYQQLLKYEKSFQEVRKLFLSSPRHHVVAWVFLLRGLKNQPLLNQVRVCDKCVYSAQMELCLKHLIVQERELVTSVNNLPQTEQALKKLDLLESSAQVSHPHAILRILAPAALLRVLKGFPCAPPPGGDGPSSDHRPPRTPAVRCSPLRRGAHHAALQRAATLLRHAGRGPAGQTRPSAADAPAAALPSTGSDCSVAVGRWLVG